MRVWAVKGIEAGAQSLQLALPQAVLLLGQHHDAAPFRGLVGQGGQLGRVGQLVRSSTPVDREKAAAWRLPRVMVPVLSSSSTSTSPAASTARPEVAMTLAWISRSMPAMPMAEQQPADGGGDQADQQGHQDRDGDRRALPGGLDAKEREGQQGAVDQQEDDRESRQQDVQGDLVGRLLPLGAFHHGDHAVQEGLARDWR